MKSRPHIAVIGAGAFGGWTALHLQERGARVTLLDAWGPGNSRASSGGETRVMRGTYGPDQPYTAMAARALKLWTKYERRWKRHFLHRTGVLWMAPQNDDAFERGSIKTLRQSKIKFHELSAAQMKKRWPQINFEGIEWAIFEPTCGYLDARASCQAVVEVFQAAGGKYRQAAVLPDGLETELLRAGPLYAGPLCAGGPRVKFPSPERPRAELPRAALPRAELRGRAALQGRVSRAKTKRALAPVSAPLKADIYVFACGPWLGKLFPQTIGDLIQPTKQDIFFFGSPAGDTRFTDAHLPVWGDHRNHFFYGIPGSDSRGFKIADDTRGPAFDPTTGERTVNPETLKDVREYIAFRFPALKNAPLLEARVCQYEQTPDSNFIMDRHPKNESIWLLGGGSGHGFKHGPAIGELLSDLILKEKEAEPIFRLSRFKKP
jgi:glycine/D-amino acid oxidase-like deaminating enzyme